MGEYVRFLQKRRANLLSSEIASGNNVNGSDSFCVESLQIDKYTSSEVCYTVQMFQSTKKDRMDCSYYELSSLIERELTCSFGLTGTKSTVRNKPPGIQRCWPRIMECLKVEVPL